LEGPVNLTAHDLAKLAASGISPELAGQAQLRRVDSREGGDLVGRNGSGDYAGLVFPYIWPGEAGPREYRLRRDHPDLEYNKDGKPREQNKYLTAPGRGNLLYLVPGTLLEWLADPNLPIVVVEGEKKTLALWASAWEGLGDSAEMPRFLPIGVAGVWSWRGTVGKTNGPDGERRNVKGMIADMSRITWKGRKVTVLYDTNVRDNDSVQSARSALTSELQRLGAVVSWFTWPKETPPGVNGIDDLLGRWGAVRVRKLMADNTRPVKVGPEQKSAVREFTKVDEDRYLLTIPVFGTSLELDRVRWEHNDLVGMLSIRCELPGAKTAWGNTLSVAEFNISGPRARLDRAKFLAERTSAPAYDWVGLMEELCQRVLADQCDAPPMERLADIPEATEADRWLEVSGMKILAGHPTVFFGDGGSAKSYLALRLGGLIAQSGINVALFDWELAGGDHRYRYRMLFGEDMPRNLWYSRLTVPLSKCQDGLRKAIKDKGIDFAISDSVGFACGGIPEAAESALSYYAAVRRVCPGSLHIAHRTKNGENGDKYPFGSVFWNNGARMTWYMEGAEEAPNSPVLNIAMHNRKGNLGGRVSAPIGFTLVFSEERTTVRSSDPVDNPDLAGKVPLWRRIESLLKRGPLSVEEIAEATDTPAGNIRAEYNRRKGLFIVVDGKVGLLAAGGRKQA
jgi:hypothetical protein